MRSFEAFALSVPGLREALFYWDTGYSREDMEAFLQRITLENLILTGPGAERMGKQPVPGARIRIIPFEKVLKEEKQIQTLIFAGVWDPEPVGQLASKGPETVAGEMLTEGAFFLWEKFRTCASRIHVDTAVGRERALQWERGRNKALSVVVPIYNVEAYLPRCLETLTAWKAEYVEFLLIDDGSTDGSGQIADRWARRDSRIRVLHKSNGGCASARQLGLRESQGSYVGFVDPDDFVDPSMFRRLLRAAMTGSFEISYCGYREYYEATGECSSAPDLLGRPWTEGTEDPDLIRTLAQSLPIAIWRGIYSRELLRRERIGFHTSLPRFDDLPFKLEVFLRARSVIALPEHLYYYRLQRPGQDVAADDRRLFVHFAIFQYLNSRILPGGSQQDRDVLQMCKIQTHRHGIQKLRGEFLRDYVGLAREDLRSSGSFFRTWRMARQELGRQSALVYLAIMGKQVLLLRLLNFRE